MAPSPCCSSSLSSPAASPERKLLFRVLGLLIVQGMLVHLNQWFGLSMIAALHPVNALVLTYASLTLAKRSSADWKTDPTAEPMETVVAGRSAGLKPAGRFTG